jgi:hypothetical protein
MYASRFKRFTASGAIETGNQKICGILVNCINADSTVNIYDGAGVTADTKFFGVRFQLNTHEYYPLEIQLRNGGYVEIDGNVEVFIYFK